MATARSRRRDERRVARRVVPLVLVLVVLAVAHLVARTSSPRLSAQQRACHTRAERLPPADPMTVSQSLASPPSPFVGHPLWRAPYPAADEAVRRLRDHAPATADRVAAVAREPRAMWLTDPARPSAATADDVAGLVAAARGDGGVLTLVLYGIPLRDCGGASSGGADGAAPYRAWVRSVVTGLSRHPWRDGDPGVAVVVEPDALGQLDLLPDDRRVERLALLADTMTTLAQVRGVGSYLDAGHSGWLPADEMAERLARGGVGAGRGFSLNVSGYRRTSDEVAYATTLSGLLGGKRAVVDVSRNGNGPAPDDAWCNPPGRALGERPTAQTAPPLDAVLWVKPPAESDGRCRPGEPDAGEFWPERANALAIAAGWP